VLLIAIGVLIIVLAFPRAAAAKPFTLNADGQLPLKVGNMPGIDSAKVEVAGLKADNTPGKAAKAKLKAKPKKRGKEKRR
jgi:hypothetical protein